MYHYFQNVLIQEVIHTITKFETKLALKALDFPHTKKLSLFTELNLCTKENKPWGSLV
jgi:hypothetical protein